MTCTGGLGRSGTVAACFLVAAGTPAKAAIAAVRSARGGPRALETIAQENFVVTFASAMRGRRLQAGSYRRGSRSAPGSKPQFPRYFS